MWDPQKKRPSETLVMSAHPPSKSGGVKVAPMRVGKCYPSVLPAPGLLLLHEQVISIETSPTSHIRTRPAQATHLNYPTGGQAPEDEAGLAGPPSPGESKWLLKRAHDLTRKDAKDQHGLGWPSLYTPPGHHAAKRHVQTVLSQKKPHTVPVGAGQGSFSQKLYVGWLGS